VAFWDIYFFFEIQNVLFLSSTPFIPAIPIPFLPPPSATNFPLARILLRKEGTGLGDIAPSFILPPPPGLPSPPCVWGGGCTGYPTRLGRGGDPG